MPSNHTDKEMAGLIGGTIAFVVGRVVVHYLSRTKDERMKFFKQKTTWTGLAAILASIGQAVATRDYVQAIPGILAGVGLLTAADSSQSATPKQVEAAIDRKLDEVSSGVAPLSTSRV